MRAWGLRREGGPSGRCAGGRRSLSFAVNKAFTLKGERKLQVVQKETNHEIQHQFFLTELREGRETHASGIEKHAS